MHSRTNHRNSDDCYQIAGVDARKFGNEYVSDLVTLGYVQSVCKTGKGQGVKRKRDRIDKPPCQSMLRSSETRDTFNVTFVSVNSCNIKDFRTILPLENVAFVKTVTGQLRWQVQWNRRSI
ncbi:Uncharacterized protein DBV15_11855 [Temnothorax longispinosus]|uniref:Uncharacterized protein n=1 Tax=Temnothorax longispinosus TaxID=300112 RepID=A0A4S2KRU4_9HYME|nr:Uncharacterized protein DBV15_11855 [Temnothorax longispinosus]